MYCRRRRLRVDGHCVRCRCGYLRLLFCYDTGNDRRRGRKSALSRKALSIHRAVPEDLDEPIAKYSFLRLPCCLRFIVCRKAHECFRTRRINGDVRDGSETLEPGIDRVERKLVLRDLLNDKRLVAAAFGMKTLYFATVNAWTTAAPACGGVLRSARRAERVRRWAACRGVYFHVGNRGGGGTCSVRLGIDVGRRHRAFLSPCGLVVEYRRR